MALSHSVVRHVCLSVDAFAGVEIRLAGVAIAAFSLVALRVPCDGVRGQCRHCCAAPAGESLACRVADDRVDDRKFRRSLLRFHRHQDRFFFPCRHDCHDIVRRGAYSRAVRGQSSRGCTGLWRLARCSPRWRFSR